MISISKNRLYIFVCTSAVLCISFLVIGNNIAHAQGTVSLSVSPTLYEMTAEPGQIWRSSIRVVNSNAFPLTVYLDTVNFEPAGESGRPRFLPITDSELMSSTLAGWIDVDDTEVVIPPEQTMELPFIVDVPDDAAPGGHFAAVLVGTRPPEDENSNNQVETSQIVTSLVFLRVAGTIVEDGAVRSFRTTQSILESPSAQFELRFENTGNVHLLPQGEIEIFNMWGQERGVIPVNQSDLFGNVLPSSVRKFTFNWTGEWSIADIGRYYAVATLGYGQEGRQFTTANTAFWVIPWKPLLLVVVILIGFIVFVSKVIRWYVRRVLHLAGASADYTHLRNNQVYVRPDTASKRPDMLDLRGQFRTQTEESGYLLGTVITIKNNYRIILTTIIFILFIILIISYFKGAFTDSRAYEVEIIGPNNTVTVNSEEVAYNETATPNENQATENNESGPKIEIINRSGISGLAASLRVALESKGIKVDKLSTELNSDTQNTVIVYTPSFADQALALSGQINNALLSAYNAPVEREFDITIYVGSDYESEVE